MASVSDPVDPPTRAAPPAAGGLTTQEAERRLAAAGPRRRPPSSRSYASIVRANVLTVFNLILAAFGAVTLVFGDWRDALFLGILVANTTIGIAQEVRAKHALDRLAVLVAPTARAIRDGAPRPIAVDALVVGDRVDLQAGDQIVADGRLVAAAGLRLDESVVTGESAAVARDAGDELRSGAFVVEGAGVLDVTAVGEGSYADRLLGQARSFRHPRSPLEQGVNRLLLATLALVVGLGALLGYSLWHQQASAADATATATAGVISMVPEGLVLLVSLTFAVGAVRMARRGVLAQQLNAIESLASADVICLDKTGTLTEPDLHVIELLPADGVSEDDLRAALGAYAASAPARNATLEAIARSLPAAPQPVLAQVPFASRRRWSALRLGAESDTYILGAPELLAGDVLRADALERQRAGRRVVALASSAQAPEPAAGEPALPAATRPLGVAVLAERLRPEARETVAFLLAE
ncbi:MAG TPA: HAD-IC family P-type ATPase, partial [Solirubrobacteraceae bacterium]